ncbi:MAG: hypothetical protein GX859_01365 [Corynebacterium humireducens]|mgnify:CR=1 FL=1|jgi:hypothetical protein|uniref:Uncharacterized protein n=1 Tax=Corynebacterium humireducens TaxID=1223514 RepID=A0A7X6PL02_9CORY|nr:hypothetical protein [Corynebacterium humireducens]
MNTRNIITDSDPIHADDLRELATMSGPTVSIVIPTHRGGAETLSDSQRLRPLLDQARRELAERYPDVDAESLLAPIQSLADSRRFWQTQVDGLAIYASPGGGRYFRTERDFTPGVTVGDHPNLRPILPLAVDDLRFLLLAVSRGSVRLFEADRATITQLPLGNIPGSDEDAEGVSTREPQLQHQASQNAGAHGHGPRDYNVLEGFLKQVSKAVEARFSGDGRPLILAAVEEYRGAVGEHLDNVVMLDRIVAGSPKALSPVELHAKAWPIAKAEADRRHDVTLERLGEAVGTGRATHDTGLISREAEVGRVSVLALAERALTADERAAELDAAIAHTLANRGVVDVVPEMPGNHATGAVFRY